jgi:predicted phage tail protein
LKLIIKPSNNSRISLISLNTITEADASIITTFNNQHQTLQAQTSELDAIAKKAIADAIAHRVAEAEALWQNSVRLANVALATATSAEVDANNAVNSDGSFASKEAALTVLKEANAAINMAIRARDRLVFLTLSSACIDTSNAALYCFDTSIAAHLSAKLSSPLITLVAAIRAVGVN